MLREKAAAAFGLVLFASPAFAGAPPPPSPLYSPVPSITGDISAALGWISISSVSTGVATVGGRANIPFADGWNIEPDITLATTFSPSVTEVGGVLHLYKALPQASLGVFGGGFGLSAPYGNTSTWTFGGEAALYSHPNSIIGLQASLNSVSNGTSYPQVEGSWDYFFNPNFKATGQLEWFGGSSGGSSTTVETIALTKRFTGTQLSGFLSGSLAQTGSNNAVLGLIGATWNFDPPGTTLYQHDRSVPFAFATTLF